LEFIDEQGNLVQNAFNNTVRVIDYAPNGHDTLSQLVRGELSLETAKSIINPNISVPQNLQLSPSTLPLVEKEPVSIPNSTQTPEESPISEEIPPVATESEESEIEVSPTSESSSTDSSIPEPLISPWRDKVPANNSIEAENSSSMTQTTETSEDTSSSEPEPISSPINSLQTEQNLSGEIFTDPEKTTHNP